MTALYTHTTRASGTILTASIYNADHQNHITYGDAQYLGGWSNSVAQMQIQTDAGETGAENLGSSISDEIERLRFAVYETKAKIDSSLTYWYQTPNAQDISGDAPYPPMYINQFTLNSDTSLPGMVIVNPGCARSKDGLMNLKTQSAIAKSVTGLWASQVATGSPGAGVTMGAKQCFHVFVFKTAASTFDIGFDTTLTASNLMARASATHYRRVGSLFTGTAAGTVRGMFGVHDGFQVYRTPGFTNPSFRTSVTQAGGFHNVRINWLPTGFTLRARYSIWATGGAAIRLIPLDWPAADGPIGVNEQYMSQPSAGMQIVETWTTPCGDIAFIDNSATAAAVLVQPMGWFDPRIA